MLTAAGPAADPTAMKRTRQRSMAAAVEFLKAHGGDPTGWTARPAVVGRRSTSRLPREIEALAAEATRSLARTRDADVVDTFGPQRP